MRFMYQICTESHQSQQNGDEDAANNISDCNLQEMVVDDDQRSQITESKSERIENDFSGNQPISAWQ